MQTGVAAENGHSHKPQHVGRKPSRCRHRVCDYILKSRGEELVLAGRAQRPRCVLQGDHPLAQQRFRLPAVESRHHPIPRLGASAAAAETLPGDVAGRVLEGAICQSLAAGQELQPLHRPRHPGGGRKGAGQCYPGVGRLKRGCYRESAYLDTGGVARCSRD